MQDAIEEASDLTFRQNLAQIPAAFAYASAEMQRAGIKVHELSPANMEKFVQLGGYQRAEWNDFKQKAVGSLAAFDKMVQAAKHACARAVYGGQRLKGGTVLPPAVKRWAERDWERPALLVLYAYIVAVIFIEVVRRFVFSYSSVWGEETARYAFAYLVWIGAAAAVRERAHIRIGVIFQFLSGRAKTALYLLGEVATLLFACIALYYTAESTLVSIKYDALTSGLRINRAWFTAAVPLGFVLIILRLIGSIARDVDDLRSGRAPFTGTRHVLGRLNDPAAGGRRGVGVGHRLPAAADCRAAGAWHPHVGGDGHWRVAVAAAHGGAAALFDWRIPV